MASEGVTIFLSKFCCLADDCKKADQLFLPDSYNMSTLAGHSCNMGNWRGEELHFFVRPPPPLMGKWVNATEDVLQIMFTEAA